MYIISDGTLVDIKIGDWVEIVPGLLKINGTNGLSYEVIALFDFEVGIMVEFNNGIFSEVVLSPVYIVANYRRV